MQQPKSAIMLDANSVQVEFLQRELELSMCFASIASETDDAQKFYRNVLNARKGYDTICHFLHKVDLPTQQRQQIMEHLARLRLALVKLGERV